MTLCSRHLLRQPLVLMGDRKLPAVKRRIHSNSQTSTALSQLKSPPLPPRLHRLTQILSRFHPTVRNINPIHDIQTLRLFASLTKAITLHLLQRDTTASSPSTGRPTVQRNRNINSRSRPSLQLHNPDTNASSQARGRRRMICHRR